MKKTNYILLFTLLALCSCQGNESVIESVNPYAEKTIQVKENIDLIKVQGRYQLLKDGISCDHSASAIEFTLDCVGEVKITVKSEYNDFDFSEEGKRGLTLFSTYVDGIRTQKNLEVDNETKELIIASSLPRGHHSFALVRQTNVYMSQAIIESLSFQGTLLREEENSCFIEYIGDSYTTGYSLQGSKEGGGYDSFYDDPLDAYAYQSAKNLHADYSINAFSGAGFAYGYTKFTVSQVYPYTNYFRTDCVSYSPKRKADIIVINLGTNDVAKVGFYDRREQIKEGIKTLVEEIYSYHSKEVPIVFCTDATHENNDPVMSEAMSEYFPESNYTFAYLTTNNQKFNGHPDAECGNQQGKELSDYLKEMFPDLC